MNAIGQGHLKAVSLWTSDMVIYTNIVSNIFSAVSLVRVPGERLQDHWSSGYELSINHTPLPEKQAKQNL